jgi:hypothetical protein
VLKLVYGCLAFSLIACVFLFVSASQKDDGFHGMTKSMGDAIANGATVLDADRNGAVIQTGNGKVSGFKHDGTQTWSTRYDRFKARLTNPFGAGADDASAWCPAACPGALVEFIGDFAAFGGADAELAASLGDLHPKPEEVLAFGSDGTAFIRIADEGQTVQALNVLAPGGKATPLAVENPSDVQPLRPHDKAVVGSINGNAKVGNLDQLILGGGSWRVAGRPLREAGLKNVCVSTDNKWVGSISTRIRRSAFGGAKGEAFGPAVIGGTCSVDDAGITAVFNRKPKPTDVVAARFAPNGRMLWVRNFGGQRLLSKAGSPYVVVQTSDSTITAMDAISGRDAFTGKVEGSPFVGRDGSIVTANRKGEPRWVLDGRAAAAQ